MSIDKAIEKARRAARDLRQLGDRGLSGVSPLTPQDGFEVSALESGNAPILRQLRIDPVISNGNRILLSEAHRHGALEGADSAYRLLRSRTRHRIVSGNWWRLAITSPGPGEGKTTTALNLALSIARENNRTVLVMDLDLRHPSALRYLGIEAPIPLSNYFSNQDPIEKVIYETTVPRLLVAGNNRPANNASELLATPGKLKQLLSTIRSWYRDPLILIDLPPASLTDEAVLVAPHVDALFMVVSEGRTRREVLDNALSLLGDATIGGLILNRFSGRQAEYYYGSY